MSTDAALFEEHSQTYCAYDRWTNVTAFDLDASFARIEGALHLSSRPPRLNLDDPWVSAAQVRMWIRAIYDHELTEEEPSKLAWILKVLLFVHLHPLGAFRIFYDYEEEYFALKEAGYTAWHGYDCQEFWVACDEACDAAERTRACNG